MHLSKASNLFKFSWDELRALPQSKVISSSYIWLFLVPISAKFLSKLESELALEIAGSNMTFSTELPFSWYVFYAAAIFFTAGNILFLARCPSLVRKYTTYQKFRSINGDEEELSRVVGYAVNTNPFMSNALLSRNLDSGTKHHPSESSAMELMFWHHWKQHNGKYPFSRLLTLALYLIGLTCMSYVLVENLIWVVNSVAF